MTSNGCKYGEITKEELALLRLCDLSDKFGWDMAGGLVVVVVVIVVWLCCECEFIVVSVIEIAVVGVHVLHKRAVGEVDAIISSVSSAFTALLNKEVVSPLLVVTASIPSAIARIP